MTKAETEERTWVKIKSNDAYINGNLSIPHGAQSIVIFAHGSGSSRFSPRNMQVAKELNNAKIATLLIDLLTKEEEEVDILTAEYRFNIDLLAQRLIDASTWINKKNETEHFSIGYFGASTGAAAALIAAAKLHEEVDAVVSRGGRPDLSEAYLNQVKAPTLLIVGGDDPIVLEMNKRALQKIAGEKKLEVVLGATHLFEETGAMAQVSKLAINWFTRYLNK
jgi:putative phosphoribosyl transferase